MSRQGEEYHETSNDYAWRLRDSVRGATDGTLLAGHDALAGSVPQKASNATTTLFGGAGDKYCQVNQSSARPIQGTFVNETTATLPSHVAKRLDRMKRGRQCGSAAAATTGAVAGMVVLGPIGAVAGALVGHQVTNKACKANERRVRKKEIKKQKQRQQQHQHQQGPDDIRYRSVDAL
uniref:Glycine zipper domain-containing protein n=1 Tax=Cyclophora tenuis TaxID=216820 RepID=A0A7S1CZ02_CYCTE